MERLPLVDVEPLRDPSATTTAVAEVARAIDAACRRTGFFLVRGHGVDPALLARLDRGARAFFALPAAEKAAIAMARAGRAWRGWFPEGGELTAGRPDAKEGLYFGAELPASDPRVAAGRLLHGPNLFPAQVPDLRPAVLGWMAAMTGLGHQLVRGVALALGLPGSWFDEHLTADPTVLFRIFRYPGRGDRLADRGWGVAEHTDYGLLTILAHDGRPGLQVHAADGWIDVPAVDDAFVVNLGDMLERMTGGRYRSTPHRVRSQEAGATDRLSFPFFFDPGWDAEVLPVPGLDATAETGGVGAPRPRWDGAALDRWSGTYGDYLTAKVAKVFPDLP